MWMSIAVVQCFPNINATHTNSQSIQLLHHKLHVLGPGNRETSRAHQVGNTLGIVVRQLGNMMD